MGRTIVIVEEKDLTKETVARIITLASLYLDSRGYTRAISMEDKGRCFAKACEDINKDVRAN